MVEIRSLPWRRWVGRAIGLLIFLPFSYFAAALAGGLIPANRDWTPPAQGLAIFVETNGVHTWIAVPAVTPQMDWRPVVPAAHLRNPAMAGNYVAFGYGNREFYLNTPTWGDLTVGRALGAVFGNGPSLMHVYHERDPKPGDDRRPIILTSEQYRRLSAYILASFARDREGRTRPLAGRGYGEDDVFYEARGGYNLFRTCNQWTGSALRVAGVRVGLWTPFSQSVMARFR